MFSVPSSYPTCSRQIHTKELNSYSTTLTELNHEWSVSRDPVIPDTETSTTTAPLSRNRKMWMITLLMSTEQASGQTFSTNKRSAKTMLVGWNVSFESNLQKEFQHIMYYMFKYHMHYNFCLSAATESQTTNPSSDELLFLSRMMTLTQTLNPRLEQIHFLHLHLVLSPIRNTRKQDSTCSIYLHSITVMHRSIGCYS